MTEQEHYIRAIINVFCFSEHSPVETPNQQGRPSALTFSTVMLGALQLTQGFSSAFLRSSTGGR